MGEVPARGEQSSQEQAESAPARDTITLEENPASTLAVAVASTPPPAEARDLALVAVSSSSPSPSLMAGRVDDQSLVEEVLKEFNPAHRILEMTSAWANLSAGVATFDEKLQVSFPWFFLLFLPSASLSLSLFLFSFRPFLGSSPASSVLVRPRRSWSPR